MFNKVLIPDAAANHDWLPLRPANDRVSDSLTRRKK